MTPARARAIEDSVDETHMRHALRLARSAYRRGEVPIGAVAVIGDEVVAAASNAMEGRQDPTAHAEMLVLQRASRVIGSWRLSGVTVYATLEPCAMCAGAMVLARVDRCVYGARDPKKGADGSVVDVLRHQRNNHRVSVRSGVNERDAADLLTRFFRAKREARASSASDLSMRSSLAAGSRRAEGFRAGAARSGRDPGQF